jgi:hypothetical protein
MMPKLSFPESVHSQVQLGNEEQLNRCRRQSRGNLGREGGSHERSNARPEQLDRMHELRVGQ